MSAESRREEGSSTGTPGHRPDRRASGHSDRLGEIRETVPEIQRTTPCRTRLQIQRGAVEVRARGPMEQHRRAEATAPLRCADAHAPEVEMWFLRVEGRQRPTDGFDPRCWPVIRRGVGRSPVCGCRRRCAIHVEPDRGAPMRHGQISARTRSCKNASVEVLLELPPCRAIRKHPYRQGIFCQRAEQNLEDRALVTSPDDLDACTRCRICICCRIAHAYSVNRCGALNADRAGTSALIGSKTALERFRSSARPCQQG